MKNIFSAFGALTRRAVATAGRRALAGIDDARFAPTSRGDLLLQEHILESVDLSAQGGEDFLAEDLDEFLPENPPSKPWKPAFVALMAASGAGLTRSCEKLCAWDRRLARLDGDYGDTALMAAARAEGDFVETVRALLPWSDPLKIRWDRGSSSALIDAIVSGNVQTALALAPLSPLESSDDRDPPLAVAALCWEPRICEALLLAGADANWVGGQGQTLLHQVASGSGTDEEAGLECARMLSTPQALLAKDAEGHAPKDLARQGELDRLEAFFQSAQAALEERQTLEGFAAGASRARRSPSL